MYMHQKDACFFKVANYASISLKGGKRQKSGGRFNRTLQEKQKGPKQLIVKQIGRLIMKKGKTGFLFVILSFFFCFAVSAYGATAKNTIAYFDSVCIAPADSSEASAIDGVKLKIKKSYLSNEKFGTKKIRSIRPGQSDLWGVYNVTLSGGDDWLLREYSIPAFGYLKDFYDHHSPGKIHFSWGGWEIPDNKAIGNKSYTFEYCITGNSGFTKTKKLKFKVKREAITNSTRAYFKPKLPKELKKSIKKRLQLL